MIDFEPIVTFIAASALLCIAPGPDNIFVVMQSALYGRKSGLLVTLGLCTGLVAHTILVALGISVLLLTSEKVFTLIKILGAVYLLYLAWHAFKTAASDAPQAVNHRLSQLTQYALYRRGIVMNVTNPKVSLFFLAFLPQFASIERGALAPQMFFLGLVFILVAAMVFSALATLAGKAGGWLEKTSRTQKTLTRLAATVYVLLAVKLLT